MSIDDIVGVGGGDPREAQVRADIQKHLAQPVQMDWLGKKVDVEKADPSKYPLPVQIGGGIMKKTADIAMGISGLGERALKKVLPRKAEEFLGLEEGRTVAEKLVPRDITKPETTGERVGGIALDLGIMFTPFPFKGLNLPAGLANASPALNLLDDLFKVGTRGAVEFGTKGGLLDRFSEESVKRGATTGAIAEMAVMGLTKFVGAIAPPKAPPKPSVVPEPIPGKPKIVPKPIPGKPGYVPKPDDSMANTPLLKQHTERGWTASSVMEKLKIKADATVKDVAQFVQRQMPFVGKQLDDATAKVKKDVDVNSFIRSMRNYAKEQRGVNMLENAKFADELATNIEYSPGVIKNGLMPMSEVVKWKQRFGKVTFQDPAVKWKKEVYDVARGAMREIAHQDKTVAKADETFEQLYALRDATRKAMPSVDAAALKYEQAAEKEIVNTIRQNAVQLQKYEQALEVAAKAVREKAIVAGEKYAQKVAIKGGEYTAKMAEADRVKYGIPTSVNPRAIMEYVSRVFLPAIKESPKVLAEFMSMITD